MYENLGEILDEINEAFPGREDRAALARTLWQIRSAPETGEEVEDH